MAAAEVALSRALNPMNGVSTTFTTLGIAFALAVYAVGSFISSKKAKSPVEQLADANVTHDREAFRACAKRLGMKIGHARRLLREHEKRSRRPPVIPEGDESAGVERIVPKALGVGRARNSTAERKMKRGNNDEKASNTKSKSSVARLEDWVSTHFQSADDPKMIAKGLIRGFLKEFRGVARPFDFSPVAWALNRIEAKNTESITLALKKATETARNHNSGPFRNATARDYSALYEFLMGPGGTRVSALPQIGTRVLVRTKGYDTNVCWLDGHVAGSQTARIGDRLCSFVHVEHTHNKLWNKREYDSIDRDPDEFEPDHTGFLLAWPPHPSPKIAHLRMLPPAQPKIPLSHGARVTGAFRDPNVRTCGWAWYDGEVLNYDGEQCSITWSDGEQDSRKVIDYMANPVDLHRPDINAAYSRDAIYLIVFQAGEALPAATQARVDAKLAADALLDRLGGEVKLTPVEAARDALRDDEEAAEDEADASQYALSAEADLAIMTPAQLELALMGADSVALHDVSLSAPDGAGSGDGVEQGSDSE